MHKDIKIKYIIYRAGKSYFWVDTYMCGSESLRDLIKLELECEKCDI